MRTLTRNPSWNVLLGAAVLLTGVLPADGSCCMNNASQAPADICCKGCCGDAASSVPAACCGAHGNRRAEPRVCLCGADHKDVPGVPAAPQRDRRNCEPAAPTTNLAQPLLGVEPAGESLLCSIAAGEHCFAAPVRVILCRWRN